MMVGGKRPKVTLGRESRSRERTEMTLGSTWGFFSCSSFSLSLSLSFSSSSIDLEASLSWVSSRFLAMERRWR